MSETPRNPTDPSDPNLVGVNPTSAGDYSTLFSAMTGNGPELVQQAAQQNSPDPVRHPDPAGQGGQRRSGGERRGRPGRQESHDNDDQDDARQVPPLQRKTAPARFHSAETKDTLPYTNKALPDPGVIDETPPNVPLRPGHWREADYITRAREVYQLHERAAIKGAAVVIEARGLAGALLDDDSIFEPDEFAAKLDSYHEYVQKTDAYFQSTKFKGDASANNGEAWKPETPAEHYDSGWTNRTRVEKTHAGWSHAYDSWEGQMTTLRRKALATAGEPGSSVRGMVEDTGLESENLETREAYSDIYDNPDTLMFGLKRAVSLERWQLSDRDKQAHTNTLDATDPSQLKGEAYLQWMRVRDSPDFAGRPGDAFVRVQQLAENKLAISDAIGNRQQLDGRQLGESVAGVAEKYAHGIGVDQEAEHRSSELKVLFADGTFVPEPLELEAYRDIARDLYVKKRNTLAAPQLQAITDKDVFEEYREVLDELRWDLSRKPQQEPNPRKSGTVIEKVVNVDEYERLQRIVHAGDPTTWPSGASEGRMKGVYQLIQGARLFDEETDGQVFDRVSRMVTLHLYENGMIPGRAQASRSERPPLGSEADILNGDLRDVHEAGPETAPQAYAAAERRLATVRRQIIQVERDLATFPKTHPTYDQLSRRHDELIFTYVTNRYRLGEVELQNRTFKSGMEPQYLPDKGMYFKNGDRVYYPDGSVAPVDLDDQGKISTVHNAVASGLESGMTRHIPAAVRSNAQPGITAEVQAARTRGDDELSRKRYFEWFEDQGNGVKADTARAHQRAIEQEQRDYITNHPGENNTDRMIDANVRAHRALFIGLEAGQNGARASQATHLRGDGSIATVGEYYGYQGNWVIHPNGSMDAYELFTAADGSRAARYVARYTPTGVSRS